MALPFQNADELFEGLTEDDTRNVVARFTERRLPPESVLFPEGSEGDALFILREGFVKLLHVSEKGTETILHILREGEMFGELILSGLPRPFTAVAITEVCVDILSRDDLREALLEVPDFALGFLALLSRRMGRVERDFARLLTEWAYHRLARELLHLAGDLGEKTPLGTRISLRLTHEDLANLIGTSRETVTNQLKRFEEMGLLHREGRRIVIHPERLRDYIRTREE